MQYLGRRQTAGFGGRARRCCVLTAVPPMSKGLEAAVGGGYYVRHSPIIAYVVAKVVIARGFYVRKIYVPRAAVAVADKRAILGRFQGSKLLPPRRALLWLAYEPLSPYSTTICGVLKLSMRGVYMPLTSVLQQRIWNHKRTTHEAQRA